EPLVLAHADAGASPGDLPLGQVPRPGGAAAEELAGAFVLERHAPGGGAFDGADVVVVFVFGGRRAGGDEEGAGGEAEEARDRHVPARGARWEPARFAPAFALRARHEAERPDKLRSMAIDQTGARGVRLAAPLARARDDASGRGDRHRLVGMLRRQRGRA